MRFGEHQISTTVDCVDVGALKVCLKWKVEDYLIQSIIIHEEHSSETKENDIAMIRLIRSVELSVERYYINTICLPIKDTQQIDNVKHKILKIAGWGTTSYSKSYGSDVLMFAEVQYIEQTDCEDFYDKMSIAYPTLTLKIKGTMMCAGGKNNVDT